MKVCFLAGTLGQGGAERQLLYMLEAAGRAGVERRVICLTRGEVYEERIRALGVEVEWVGENETKLYRLGKIINNLRRRRPDIVQSAHFYTNIYAGLAGKIIGLKSIGAIRSNLTHELAANGLYGKWQLKSPDHLIANSQSAREKAVGMGLAPERIDFLSNAVDSFAPVDAPPAPRGKLNILFVGRLTEVKRPEIFVELALYLNQQMPERDLRFQMVGDGPLFENVSRLVKNNNLPAEKFSLLGNRNDVAALYREADLLVLPSRFEGTPNVVLEAMASGLPVVATRVGGVPEIVSERCGILVDPDDKQELFAATQKLVADESLRRALGREGKDYVARHHSLEYLERRLTGIYEKVLTR